MSNTPGAGAPGATKYKVHVKNEYICGAQIKKFHSKQKSYFPKQHYKVNTLHNTEKGLHSTQLCSLCLQNGALINSTFDVLENKTKLKLVLKEHLSYEGRELCHFLPRCDDSTTAENLMAISTQTLQ